MKYLISAFLVVLAGAVSAQDTAPRLAKIVEVKGEASDVTRQFFGHVAAKETVDLAFQVGGQIVEIPIVEGEPIQKGALIARLDLEPFELALDQAIVQQEQAERTLLRLEKLQGNTVSQVTVDDADTQLKLSEISVRNAERSLRDAEITAPFDALVATRNAANFSTIAAGTPIVRLHDLSELRVEIDVPEVLFQQAGENPDVDLFAKFPASDTLFPLEVREFNAETSQVGQTFRITLGMAPPENLVVLPGASVTVFATLRGGPSVLRIPNSAVIAANDGATQVMVFSPTDADEGTVSLVPVKVVPGPRGGVLVEEGLTEGQQIVASGASLLSDGDRVKRFTGFSN
ncbi:efflux RND transporter periplasmic adaptor subunit [Roseobacteraceae bacterium S113]